MNKTDIKKQVFIGFIVGLIATAIGFYFYTQIFNKFTFKFVKILIKEQGMLPTFLTYATVPNLLAFFVFIKKKEDYKARGVLMATIFVALIILFSKFWV